MTHLTQDFQHQSEILHKTHRVVIQAEKGSFTNLQLLENARDFSSLQGNQFSSSIRIPRTIANL